MKNYLKIKDIQIIALPSVFKVILYKFSFEFLNVSKLFCNTYICFSDCEFL